MLPQKDKARSALGRALAKSLLEMALPTRRAVAPLLDRLAQYLDTRQGKALSSKEVELLRSIIGSAGSIYYGARYMDEGHVPSIFHELGVPLAEVIRILKHESTVPYIEIALGEVVPLLTPKSEYDRSLKRGAVRYKRLLRDLDLIARAVPLPPKRGRGRPAKRDLLLFVNFLSRHWESATNERFTHNWHKGEPLTRGTQFLHAALWIVDPERLSKLPEMTKKLASRYRAAERRLSINGNAS
jgi:hypothetical protein